MEPTLRIVPAASDSALLASLAAVMAVGLFCLPTLRRILTDMLRRLFRRNRNATTTELTLSERLVVGVGIGQTLVFEALTLYALTGATARPPLAAMGGLLILAAALFGVQLAGYAATGYAFADAEATRSWLYVFILSQVLTGYLIVVPALGALLYPALSVWFIAAAGVCYLLCRILLYIRAFGIFYTDFGSIFYFFLYLCTLEIVPLLLVRAVSPFFSTLFC